LHGHGTNAYTISAHHKNKDPPLGGGLLVVCCVFYLPTQRCPKGAKESKKEKHTYRLHTASVPHTGALSSANVAGRRRNLRPATK